MTQKNSQIVDGDWIAFQGGELEGKRPKALCPACREQLRRVATGAGGGAARPLVLCFQCYRAELDARASDSPELKALGRPEESGAPRALEDARWQWLLPFEPVDKARLERLKTDRATARATMIVGAGRYADKRRRAQIAARHALDAIAAGLNARQLAPIERDRVMSGAIHAAELQLPESWLPFVIAR